MTTCVRINVESTLIDGALTVNGLVLHCPAFCVVDVTDLWLGPGLRGEDLLIPGRQGRVPKPKRRDVTERSLPMVIDGSVAIDGTPYTNDRAGLRATLFYLRANLGEGMPVTASLSPPPGTAGPGQSGTVHVMSITPGQKTGSLWNATLDLSIPNGALY